MELSEILDPAFKLLIVLYCIRITWSLFKIECQLENLRQKADDMRFYMRSKFERLVEPDEQNGGE